MVSKKIKFTNIPRIITINLYGFFAIILYLPSYTMEQQTNKTDELERKIISEIKETQQEYTRMKEANRHWDWIGWTVGNPNVLQARRVHLKEEYKQLIKEKNKSEKALSSY